MISENLFKRDTLVSMAAPEYVPVPLSKNQQKRANTRAGRVKMAVSDILENCRKTLVINLILTFSFHF